MILRLFASVLLFAQVVCEDGVCRLVPDEGASSPVVQTATNAPKVPVPARIAQGAMSEADFLSFLAGETPEDSFAGKTFGLILLLAILGGLALNLTPCVLPMIPVNLLVIGASSKRGLLYGLGQMAAFGSLGILAALGGVAFGTIQASPWFNACVAILFLLFALALLGVLTLDLTRFRQRFKGGVFALGVMSAVLAGACVAPVLVSVLLLTARLYAEGRVLALVLPFAVGLGLALPWPFLGAGMRILPKPGAWMRWVNRLFAILLAALAVHYGLLSFRGFRSVAPDTRDVSTREFRRTELARSGRTRPLLVVCHASWCKNCTAMERMMESSPRIRAALARLDVVRLDAEDPNELRQVPGFESIQGLPAFAFYPQVYPDF